MELTPEDDDLLSYFLSADVTTDQLTQPKLEPSAFGSAPILGNPAPVADFSFAQPLGVAPDGRSTFGVVAPSSGLGSSAGLGGSFTAGDPSMMRPSQDDDTSSVSGLDTDEKRQRRLARNRESARQSRRRKKQYLELLEEKVSQLTESIDATRATHLDRADEALNAVRTEILATLSEDLKSSTTDAEVSEKIRRGVQLIQERYGPNSLTDMIHSILTPEQSLNYLRWVDMNQERLPHYVDKSPLMANSGASDSVRAILRKSDRDLTVEDVTALLGEL
ncbi:hypothetical protein P43SY_008777 [Pythium insidiosum]|uniref:BZIP domain-containing protein n=1 Tax=Pythium insidiosum TaxID=114742 RepID=A0AAD5LJN2_PYTIN|nr:hypothetical protein P43SY_008777 [Pythium insidiosum]